MYKPHCIRLPVSVHCQTKPAANAHIEYRTVNSGCFLKKQNIPSKFDSSVLEPKCQVWGRRARKKRNKEFLGRGLSTERQRDRTGSPISSDPPESRVFRLVLTHHILIVCPLNAVNVAGTY